MVSESNAGILIFKETSRVLIRSCLGTGMGDVKRGCIFLMARHLHLKSRNCGILINSTAFHADGMGKMPQNNVNIWHFLR